MIALRGTDARGDLGGPRVFSLQRLVEVADFNMDLRPRLVWARMWRVMAAHFAAVGSHEKSASVARYALDSLRQLSLKFLAKASRRRVEFETVASTFVVDTTVVSFCRRRRRVHCLSCWRRGGEGCQPAAVRAPLVRPLS